MIIYYLIISKNIDIYIKNIIKKIDKEINLKDYNFTLDNL